MVQTLFHSPLSPVGHRQDLASAAKAAALHSAGGAPAPRRIPPGSGVASPVASEGAAVGRGVGGRQVGG